MSQIPPSKAEHENTVAHADETLDLDGEFFAIDWDELDPPAGHPDAEEIEDQVVWDEMCDLLGVARGTL